MQAQIMKTSHAICVNWSSSFSDQALVEFKPSRRLSKKLTRGIVICQEFPIDSEYFRTDDFEQADLV
jgi:hypothetical protein